MARSKVVGFNATLLEKQLLQDYINEQKQRFLEYAKSEIQSIGDKIKTYHSRNNMDRTGNLLDSLCWGVSYNGNLLEGGFYRPAQATYESGLHEWSTASFRDKFGDYTERVNADLPVNGHQLASEYIEKYGNNSSKGWKVFFAILAPYWGYWEKGFRMSAGFMQSRSKAYGSGIRSFYQFAVMTQFYDQIKSDLKPMRTRFSVSVAKYAGKSLYSQAKKNWYG